MGDTQRDEERKEAASYLDMLSAMAESTFSPRIYETELKPAADAGPLRGLYLALVNPDKTLETMFTASLGKRLGEAADANLFYCPKDGHPLFRIEDAFLVLSYMAKESPQALKQRREQILGFVQEYLNHYAPAIKGYTTEGGEFPWADFEVRDRALDVIHLLGRPEDLPLVEDLLRFPRVELIHGPKEPEAVHPRRAEIREKAGEIRREVDERVPHPF